MAITVDGIPLGQGTPGPNSVGSAEIIDGSILGVDISPTAGIPTSALATDPLDRANHTGSPSVDVDWGSYKLRNLGAPVLGTDAATKAYADSIVASPNRSISQVSSDTVLAGTEDFVTVDTTGGVVTIDLPASPSNGFEVEIKWLLGGNALVIDDNGDTVDGSAGPFTDIYLGDALKFTWDNTQSTWLVH